ncbi:MAG: PH domain-containing protein [Clostridiaceae bacterium]|nr:PH domain-containing protein [Clostridiaceae bacterium]
MIRSMLDINEHIIWEGKPDRVTYVIGQPFMYLIALVWGAFDSIFIFAFTREDGFGSMGFFIIPFFLLHLLPVWIAIIGPFYRFIHWNYIEYAITDKRIYIASGIIGRDVKLVEFSQVREPSVRVGLIEKLRNCGTVRLTPFSRVAHSGNTVVSTQAGALLHVPEPYEVFKRVKHMSLDIQTDIAYPNAMRPEDNPGYRTKYDPDDRG